MLLALLGADPCCGIAVKIAEIKHPCRVDGEEPLDELKAPSKSTRQKSFGEDRSRGKRHEERDRSKQERSQRGGRDHDREYKEFRAQDRERGRLNRDRDRGRERPEREERDRYDREIGRDRRHNGRDHRSDMQGRQSDSRAGTNRREAQNGEAEQIPLARGRGALKGRLAVRENADVAAAKA